MVIKESQFTESPLMLLDQLDSLSEADNMSAYPPSMVTITHVNRLDQDLIRLESFMHYSQTNGISDGGLAIAKVCEACKCPVEKIGFMVSEANLYADDELMDTMVQISDAGFPVHLIEESEVSVYYTKLKEALVMDDPYENLSECENLKKYCSTSLFNEASIGEAKEAIAKKLAAVRKAIAEKITAMQNANGANKAFLAKQLDKLKAMANNLKGRLVDAKNNVAAKFA